jgi:hypothetical protein
MTVFIVIFSVLDLSSSDSFICEQHYLTIIYN